MEFKIRIAEKNIFIHSVYSYIYELCKDYVIEEDSKTDLIVFSNEDKIRNEYERVKLTDADVPGNKMLESLLIQRSIAHSLLDFDSFLMHGAVIAVCGASYMFSAKSGTGKTTHIKKWIENVEGSYVVNGDKPIIMLRDNRVFACGTPWCGKEGLGTNTIVPLHSIVFMERSNVNRIELIPFRSAIPLLIEQTFLPEDAEKMRKTIRLLFSLRNCIPFYKFYFNNYAEDVFEVPFHELTNLKG